MSALPDHVKMFLCVADHVTVRMPPFTGFRIVPVKDKKAVDILITMLVKDRNNPIQDADLTFTYRRNFSDLCLKWEEMIRLVRDLHVSALSHELDEQFYLDDARIYDPHE